jgi:hypothetical protein
MSLAPSIALRNASLSSTLLPRPWPTFFTSRRISATMIVLPFGFADGPRNSACFLRNAAMFGKSGSLVHHHFRSGEVRLLDRLRHERRITVNYEVQTLHQRRFDPELDRFLSHEQF